MTRWHTRAGRKPTGGLLKDNMKRKSRHKGSKFLETKIGGRVTKLKRTRNGGKKMKILSAEYVNITSPEAKGLPKGKEGAEKSKSKTMKAKIISVEGNPANPHYVRRNVITKGAVVKTDMGDVRITSRPGQTGSLNGVLLERKPK